MVRTVLSRSLTPPNRGHAAVGYRTRSESLGVRGPPRSAFTAGAIPRKLGAQVCGKVDTADGSCWSRCRHPSQSASYGGIPFHGRGTVRNAGTYCPCIRRLRLRVDGPVSLRYRRTSLRQPRSSSARALISRRNRSFSDIAEHLSSSRDDCPNSRSHSDVSPNTKVRSSSDQGHGPCIANGPTFRAKSVSTPVGRGVTTRI